VVSPRLAKLGAKLESIVVSPRLAKLGAKLESIVVSPRIELGSSV
jgi:hypothetical protein